MRLTTVSASIRNMLVTILGLFICFMVIPSSSFADPFWSIGISGGNGGINGFTLSIGDYGGIPVYIDQSGPPRGHACDYYDVHPKHHWGRENYHDEGIPHPMNRPHGYQQNSPRQNPHNQNYNRPDGYQQNGPRQNQHNQGMSRPDGYRQNGYRQTQSGQDMGRQNKNMQNISRPNRDRQHQWEMSMMNEGMSRPNQHVQSFNRPNGYQQNGSIQNHHKQNIDRQKREKQHQWEMSMLN